MPSSNDFDLSELELELETDLNSELEFDGNEKFAGEAELESMEETEADLELDSELGSEEESLDELGFGDSEMEALDGPAAEYGERFYELSEREFESPGSADTALHEVLNEMGRDYFLKRAWGRLKKRVPGVTKLVSRGMRLAKAAGINIPMIDSLTESRII